MYLYTALIFFVTTLQAVGIFILATKPGKWWLLIFGIWMALQAAVGFSGFYENTTTLPPRFVLLILPTIAGILLLFVLPAGRRFLNAADIGKLTLVHVVRIPVEGVLFGLFVDGMIPEIMTFDGMNWDIISGISALFMYYFGYINPKLSETVLLIWNVVCLGLLVNIVVIAILSVPTAFQQFGFDQPNIAIGQFPYVWLPSVVVPIVLLSHLVSIRSLVLKK
jgi:hypothetical protein